MKTYQLIENQTIKIKLINLHFSELSYSIPYGSKGFWFESRRGHKRSFTAMWGFFLCPETLECFFRGRHAGYCYSELLPKQSAE